MKTLWLKSLPLFALCLFVSACSIYTGKIDNVLVELSACAPAAESNQIKLTLRYVNENIFAIALSSTEGKMYLNNEYIGPFSNTSPVGLPQLSSVVSEGVVLIEAPAVLQKILESSAPSASYRLESVIHSEISEDKATLRSVTTGQVDLAGLRPAAK